MRRTEEVSTRCRPLVGSPLLPLEKHLSSRLNGRGETNSLLNFLSKERAYSNLKLAVQRFAVTFMIGI